MAERPHKEYSLVETGFLACDAEARNLLRLAAANGLLLVTAAAMSSLPSELIFRGSNRVPLKDRAMGFYSSGRCRSLPSSLASTDEFFPHATDD